jgi:hypothetical protein
MSTMQEGHSFYNMHNSKQSSSVVIVLLFYAPVKRHVQEHTRAIYLFLTHIYKLFTPK